MQKVNSTPNIPILTNHFCSDVLNSRWWSKFRQDKIPTGCNRDKSQFRQIIKSQMFQMKPFKISFKIIFVADSI